MGEWVGELRVFPKGTFRVNEDAVDLIELVVWKESEITRPPLISGSLEELITLKELLEIQLLRYPDLFRQNLRRLPYELIEPLEKMLCRTIKRRPTAQLFSLLKYFNDPILSAFEGLTNYEAKTLEEKDKLLHNTMGLIKEFPKVTLFNKMFGLLLEAFFPADMNFGAPCPQFPASGHANQQVHSQSSNSSVGKNLIKLMAMIIDYSTSKEYQSYLEKDALTPFRRARKLQTQAALLHCVEAFTKHSKYEEIKKDVLPIAFYCLESNSSEAQISAMESLKTLSTCCETSDFTDLIWPKCKSAIIKGIGRPRLQTSAAKCLSDIIPWLSPQLIQQEIIPFLLDAATDALSLSHSYNGSSETQTDHSSGSINSVRRRSSNIATKGIFSSATTSNRSSSLNKGHTIEAICMIWLAILRRRSDLLDVNMVASEIFPSLLPHCSNKSLNHSEFRCLMHALHSFLDHMDPTFSGSEESGENSQYQVLPAINAAKPEESNMAKIDSLLEQSQMLSLVHYPSSGCNSPGIPTVQVMSSESRCTSRNDSTSDLRTDTFFPMVHPNLLRNSAAETGRRATASVICP
ncbi:hypothetical protein Ciccas_010083, partial [Cichlidogyrus casuarinus]